MGRAPGQHIDLVAEALLLAFVVDPNDLLPRLDAEARKPNGGIELGVDEELASLGLAGESATGSSTSIRTGDRPSATSKITWSKESMGTPFTERIVEPGTIPACQAGPRGHGADDGANRRHPRSKRSGRG